MKVTQAILLFVLTTYSTCRPIRLLLGVSVVQMLTCVIFNSQVEVSSPNAEVENSLCTSQATCGSTTATSEPPVAPALPLSAHATLSNTCTIETGRMKVCIAYLISSSHTVASSLRWPQTSAPGLMLRYQWRSIIEPIYFVFHKIDCNKFPVR